VFILDDDRDLGESLEILLRLEGFDVFWAASCEEAMGKFRAWDFDLSLFDVNLPGTNGLECLRKLRKIQPDAKVMMMTAYGAPESFDEAVEVGALGLLNKPLAVDELLNMLTNLQMETPSEDSRDRR
jgi:two-component system response regulator (stage 0 sporulation protein F)